MKLPTWAELEPEQLDVLERPLDESLLVAGPPGSGKTVLAVRRAQSAAQVGEASSVAVVTFNRMLRRLLTILNGHRGNLVPRTMHSFVGRDYLERTGSAPPGLGQDSYSYDWEAMSDTLRALPSARTKHLVVDEGQDLPEGFFRYASRHLANVLTVFADDDQALGDRHTTLEQIKRAAGLSDPVLLSRNHRNTPEIARLAEHFHGGRLPAATVQRRRSGELPRLVRSPSIEATARRVSDWHETRGGSIGVIVDDNKTGADVHARLAKRLPGKRVDIYNARLKNEDSINMTASGVTVLNKESVKGQEFETVYILDLEKFIPGRTEAARRAMYMMCARARDHLFLLHGPDELSATAAAGLPGADILDRS